MRDMLMRWSIQSWNFSRIPSLSNRSHHHVVGCYPLIPLMRRDKKCEKKAYIPAVKETVARAKGNESERRKKAKALERFNDFMWMSWHLPTCAQFTHDGWVGCALRCIFLMDDQIRIPAMKSFDIILSIEWDLLRHGEHRLGMWLVECVMCATFNDWKIYIKKEGGERDMLNG